MTQMLFFGLKLMKLNQLFVASRVYCLLVSVLSVSVIADRY